MKQPSRPHQVMGTIIMLSILAVAFAFGYWLTKLIYQWTGTPPDFWAHMLSGITGIFLLVLVIVFLCFGMIAYQRRKHDGKSHHEMRLTLMDKMLESMDRIAHGDFNVLVPVDEHNPYAELAESINKMAQELGSMENLRQDFISNVSHEIQSPLTSISGFAAFLKSNDLPEDLRTHYIEIIETESKRLSKLSENLLKLSTLETGTTPIAIREYRLDKQIENTILLFEPQWSSKRMTLEADIQKLTFRGDEDLLSQVWVNLLHNAIKFTPEDGRLKITLSVENESAIVTVSDNGAGIAPEDQMHIFERFYKADKSRDRSFGGNGLGLSLVKKIVDLHNGRITVDSKPGNGSVFGVVLPVRR